MASPGRRHRLAATAPDAKCGTLPPRRTDRRQCGRKPCRKTVGDGRKMGLFAVVVPLDGSRQTARDSRQSLWRWAIYRPILRRSRFARAITFWTVSRERRTFLAMAAGFTPASYAARINRSCPGVAGAAPSGAPSFAPVPVAGPDLSIRRRAADGPYGRLRPRRRASSITAFISRPRPSSSSRRSDLPRSAGRATPDVFGGRSKPGSDEAAFRGASTVPGLPVMVHPLYSDPQNPHGPRNGREKGLSIRVSIIIWGRSFGMTDLLPGQRVSVRAETVPRGLQATEIEPI